MSTNDRTLASTENQARGIAEYALDMVNDAGGAPSPDVVRRLEWFHADSVACAVSALACGTNAPTVLRNEALTYGVARDEPGAGLFGSGRRVKPEKAVVACCSAVREWDANGTNFGHNPARGATRGEFGHNDFYPVAIAAAQIAGCDGRRTLSAMIALDEIRGRLAEVFAQREECIDHVVHGAIAAAAVYGAVLGGTVAQIESAIGMVVAHYIPFRAIRSGSQLSDSKGASAALSAEVAVLSMRRSLQGFIGPADIFRNQQAIFCLFQPPASHHTSPFDLTLSTQGDDFAVMGMHFKLGLYEHQSAGALQGLIDLLAEHPALLDEIDDILAVRITIYEPAFSIIGDPAKRDPQTRQSADHSMVYIVATALRKALATKQAGWQELMLEPADYSDDAIRDPVTRQLIDRIEFVHGGAEYDAKYPEGIPTTIDIQHRQLGWLSSGLVMFPMGHARCESQGLSDLLTHKFRLLAKLGVDDVDGLWERVTNLAEKSPQDIRELYDFAIRGVPSE